MTGHPMVEQVNRLVGNLLAGGRDLFLPGVGSLCTERRGAKRLSRHLVEPACRVVEFSSQQRGVSLVDEIARAIGEPDAVQDQARDIYDRWLNRTLTDDTLTIEGVGVLKFKHFTPDEEFDRRINPQGHAPVRIRRPRRFDWALAVGGAAILVAAVIGGYEFLMLQSDEKPAPAIAVANPEKASLGADAGLPADTSTAAPSGEGSGQVSGEVSGGEIATSGGAVTPETVSGHTDASDASDAASRASAGNAPGTASATSGSAATRASQPSGTEQMPAKLVSGRRYVVLGVFSTPANAARAARQAAEKEGSFRCGIYRFGDKFLVSPFESDDAEACNLFIRTHAGKFPGMWCYAAR